MPTSSLVLEASVGVRKQLLLPLAVSVPLELVPPRHAQGEQVQGIGLVDTGAERSLICEKILQQVEALPYWEATIVGINGIEKNVDTYLVDLHFMYEEHNEGRSGLWASGSPQDIRGLCRRLGSGADRRLSWSSGTLLSG